MQKNELLFENTAPARHFNSLIFGFFKSDIAAGRLIFLSLQPDRRSSFSNFHAQVTIRRSIPFSTVICPSTPINSLLIPIG